MLLKNDIQVGGRYIMNHSSGRITVTILRVKPTLLRGCRSGDRTMTHWSARNERTGNTIEIKSAAKLTPLPAARD